MSKEPVTLRKDLSLEQSTEQLTATRAVVPTALEQVWKTSEVWEQYQGKVPWDGDRIKPSVVLLTY